MTTLLNNILSNEKRTLFATDAGTKMHTALQRVYIDDNHTIGDTEIVSKILKNPDAVPFFSKNSKTEIPIAGTINGHFISRRIDRALINHQTQTIDILDYKTDTDHTCRHDKYTAQIREYIALLHQVYPTYTITGYILWTNNFSLEKIH